MLYSSFLKCFANYLRCDLFLVLFVWITLGAAQIYLYSTFGYGVHYLTYLALLYFVIAYVLSFAISKIHEYLLWLKPLLCSLLAISFVVNLFCAYRFHSLFSPNFIECIFSTNLQEMESFFQTYVQTEDVLLIFITFLFCFVYYCAFLLLPKSIISHVFILPFCFFLLSVLAVWHNPSIIKELSLYVNLSPDELVDVSQHPVIPQVQPLSDTHPQTIVIILGESMARSHSSIYGYSKETNPRLFSLQRAGSLVAFDSVTAPACNTTTAFRYLLTNYAAELERGTSKKWYECYNLIETLKVVGYHTCWYSNQPEFGVYENLPSGFAHICDDCHFVTRSSDEPYDGALLDLYQPDSIHNSKLIFFHLMGQHPTFIKRYPADFTFFTPAQYSGLTQFQAQVIAEYDNASRYNDYVVGEIMQLFSQQKALVFYFPDHGLDLFDSDTAYYGHGRADTASSSVGKQIPFFIYMPADFQAHFPAVVEEVHHLSPIPFSTSHFFDLLLHLSGYSVIPS